MYLRLVFTSNHINRLYLETDVCVFLLRVNLRILIIILFIHYAVIVVLQQTKL